MDHRDIHIKYDWVPKLRIKLVDANDREYFFPTIGRWMGELPDDEDWKILMTSTLNRKQCRSLWRWLGRRDKPPTKLRVYVNKEDIEREWPLREDEQQRKGEQ